MSYPTGSASIYPEDEPPFEDELHDDAADCDHEDYDLDWAIGRATCYRCSHTWYLTNEQFRQHCEWAARAAEDFDETPSFRDRLWFWYRHFSWRIHSWALSHCEECRRPNRFLGFRIGNHAGHEEEIPF
jgi:hypothetical protein